MITLFFVFSFIFFLLFLTWYIRRFQHPPPSFLRHPPLDLAFPTSFLTSLFPFPSFLFHPFLRLHPPSHNRLLSWSNQPAFFGLSKHQKDGFTSSTVTFYQKSMFNFLNPFTDRYFHLWDIFRFIFRQLRMTLFFNYDGRKMIFLQMHNTVLQMVISKCKNIKLWKN